MSVIEGQEVFSHANINKASVKRIIYLYLCSIDLDSMSCWKN